MGYHQRVGEVIRANVPQLIWLWDKILIEIHYGLGIPGAIEHIVLGIGLVWVTVSGFMMFLNTRARKKRLRSEHQTEECDMVLCLIEMVNFLRRTPVGYMSCSKSSSC